MASHADGESGGFTGGTVPAFETGVTSEPGTRGLGTQLGRFERSGKIAQKGEAPALAEGQGRWDNRALLGRLFRSFFGF
jgi:hypothetical protein